jgi:transcription antitermination factor NusG
MSFWAVARTLVRREAFAVAQLEAGGFEVFAPKTAAGPLFPGYVFVRIVERWRAVDRTLGVVNLVKFGESPARCPDDEVAALQSRVDSRGLVRLPSKPPKRSRRLKLGAHVQVGVLSAVYAGMSARERELILIDLLGRRIAVELPPGQSVAPMHLAGIVHPR